LATYLRGMTRLLFALLAAPALASAQQPLLISKPDAEHTEPFSQIVGVRELKDGRVIVSDGRDKVVQLIDFKGGATTLGREGAGPGEYALPGPIVALPGDTSAMWDGGSRRYLTFSPAAKPGASFRLEPPEGLGNRGYGAFAATAPRGMDARGNIYFQGSPFVEDARGEMTPADSVPVIMFDRAAQRPDTVAYVHPAKGAATVKPGPGGRGLNVSNGMGNPLMPLDDWTTLPDGRVAVVRGINYRIDIYEARKVAVAGAPIPYDKLRVDETMKTETLAQRRQQFASGAPRSRPGAQVNQAPDDLRAKLMAEMMNVEPWPEFAPPFLAGAVLARQTTGGGQIWVLRTRRAESQPTIYDVFEASTKLIGRVQFPPKVRVLGFGNGTMYTVRSDEDDLQYLQRYRLAADAKLTGAVVP
jgi:hypothetical protein